MSGYIGLEETIKRIREGLKKRSGKSWSVTRGRGTAYGWLRIESPPKRRVNDCMSPEDQEELSRLLGVKVYHQGASIPSSGNYYREYVDRAEGREPSVIGVPYWD